MEENFAQIGKLLSSNVMDAPIFNDDKEEAEATNFDPDFQERLLAAVRGGPKITDAHLQVLDKDFEIEGTKTKVHCYAPALDAHGRMKPRPLARFLMDRVIDYAIPRKTIEAAQAEMLATGSTAAVASLQAKARDAFTELKNTGEGGEFLLFALAEAVFGLTQILCKMSLKTSTSMHYHGADGVYASTNSDGGLDVYWGESKLYGNPTDAITDCLKSLSPFLREEFGDDATNARDIFLINEYADLTDPDALVALKRFFDPDHADSNKLRLCGFALVGFDSDTFPVKEEAGVWKEIEAALKSELLKWQKHIGKRIGEEELAIFDVHFVCVPLRSVDEFREIFLDMLRGEP